MTAPAAPVDPRYGKKVMPGTFDLHPEEPVIVVNIRTLVLDKEALGENLSSSSPVLTLFRLSDSAGQPTVIEESHSQKR
jgi:hypothetical protein